MHLGPSIIEPADAGAALRDALRSIGDPATPGPASLDPARPAPPAYPAGADPSAQDPAGRTASLLPALASLAAGRARRVRPLLDTATGPLLLLLLGRYTAWAGQLTPAAAAWGRARAAALQPAPVTADPDALVLHAAALQAAERLATDLGDPALAGRLHRPARDARQALAALPPDSPAAALASWLDLLAPDACTVPYGSADDAAGAGRAGEPAADRGAAAAAAAVVLHLVHGVAGIQPDALRHQVRIRPSLPAGSSVLEVRDVAVGEDVLGLRLEVDSGPGGGVLRLRIEQEAGPIPATALVEPFVRGGLRSARVDGRAAELSPRRARDGFRVPVQLVLDHERELELEFGAE